MKPIIFLIALTLFLAAGAAPTSIPKDVPYSDENTGVVFPPALGAFRKTEVRVNSNPVIGTRMQYSGDRLGCAADIFIYSLGERPEQITESEFQRHYNELRDGILNLKSISPKIEEVESAGEWTIPEEKRKIVRRELFYIRTDGEETYRSELVLIRCGDRIVKLRIFVPASQKEAVHESDDFIRRFAKLFNIKVFSRGSYPPGVKPRQEKTANEPKS